MKAKNYLDSITIKDFINTFYKDYANYILVYRGIPTFEDGFTNVQRKLFYTLSSLKKNKYHEMLNVIGNLKSTGYLHGDASGYKAGANMIASYIGSSNNINLFEGDGNYGSRFFRKPASMRYVKGKFADISDEIFVDTDITEKSSGFEAKEPSFYLPIIPMLIVNGNMGIGLGFATNIPPHNPINIIDYMIEILEKGVSDIKIYPYYKGYNSPKIRKIGDGKFKIKGKVKKISDKKIQITDIPPQYEYNTYVSLLDKLVDNNTLTSYVDNSSFDKFDFTVRFKEPISDDYMTILGLSKSISCNYVCIKNGSVKTYNEAEDIVDDFIEFRQEYYSKRFKNDIKKLKNDIKFLRAKKYFISGILKHLNNNSSIDKKSIMNFIKDDNYKDKLLRLSILSISNEDVEQLVIDINNLKDKIISISSKDVDDTYVEELKELRRTLTNNYNWG